MTLWLQIGLCWKVKSRKVKKQRLVIAIRDRADLSIWASTVSEPRLNSRCLSVRALVTCSPMFWPQVWGWQRARLPHGVLLSSPEDLSDLLGRGIRVPLWRPHLWQLQGFLQESRRRLVWAGQHIVSPFWTFIQHLFTHLMVQCLVHSIGSVYKQILLPSVLFSKHILFYFFLKRHLKSAANLRGEGWTFLSCAEFIDTDRNSCLRASPRIA